MALTGIVVYTCVSRRYMHQCRKRNELNKIHDHRYAKKYSTSIEQDENLVYKVEDDDNWQWVGTEPEEGKKESHPSTSQATNPHYIPSPNQQQKKIRPTDEVIMMK